MDTVNSSFSVRVKILEWVLKNFIVIKKNKASPISLPSLFSQNLLLFRVVFPNTWSSPKCTGFKRKKLAYLVQRQPLGVVNQWCSPIR